MQPQISRSSRGPDIRRFIQLLSPYYGCNKQRTKQTEILGLTDQHFSRGASKSDVTGS